MENTTLLRYHIDLTGRIQNCGFRDFCWRSAQASHVSGWVANDLTDPYKVTLEVQGTRDQIDSFTDRIYKGNGWSKITGMTRKSIPVLADEKRFHVLS